MIRSPDGRSAHTQGPRARSPAARSRNASGGGGRWWQDRRKLWGAIGGGVLLVAVAAFGAYQLLKRPDDISRGADFPLNKEKRHKVVKTTNWPMFGFDRARTRYLPAKRVKPPFKALEATATSR